MGDIQRQGRVTYGNIPNYQVFRNVKDFGAKGRSNHITQEVPADSLVGDGVSDDTIAINNAVASPFKPGGVPGNGSLRCGEGIFGQEDFATHRL